MNAMGHVLANPVRVRQESLEERIRQHLPGLMVMGGNGMFEHNTHLGMGHVQGPENTLPMAMGHGPFGQIEMGGMFTMLKVRPGLKGNEDPGWYDSEQVPRARRVSTAPEPSAADGERQEHQHDHQ